MVEEKKSATQALIVNIGQEKAVVDEAVESSKGDEEEASALSVRSVMFPTVRLLRIHALLNSCVMTEYIHLQQHPPTSSGEECTRIFVL